MREMHQSLCMAAAVVAGLSACIMEEPIEEHPTNDQSAELPAFQQKTELAAVSSQVEEVYEMEQVSYAACMLACAGGTTAVESFCRRIIVPYIAEACWRHARLGRQACENFCYNYFGG